MPSFVDTNILVYAEDADAGSKRDTARDLLTDLWKTRQGALSVQVLQEFYVTVTRKLKRPMPKERAREIVLEYLAWTVIPNTGELLAAALDLQPRLGLSFWDAMIVQAAVEAGCDHLYSEDLNAGQRYGTLTVINPFRA